jgi:CheY-like chemotaxis protein
MAPARILIVDDDPDISEAMKVVLENQGYEVQRSADSTEGMAQLKEIRPDLIILDVMMRSPREGFEFSRQIKHDPEYKDIPILMLTSVHAKTGLDFRSAVGDEAWLPVEGFLDKPVRPSVLLETVGSLLQKA